MDYHIVVSNNNKSIYWTKNIDNITVYNKEYELDSYLSYIIDHYDDLPSYLVLLKGYPFENNNYITRENIIEQIEWLLNKLEGEQTSDAIPFFNRPVLECHYQYPGIRSPDYYYKFFKGDIPSHFEYNDQNQYIVSRIGILHRPKLFYINLRQMLNKHTLTYQEAHYNIKNFNNNSIDPWTLQRIFPYIFDLNVKCNENKQI